VLEDCRRLSGAGTRQRIWHIRRETASVRMDKKPVQIEASLIGGRLVVRNCPFCGGYHVHLPRIGVHPAPCDPKLEYELIEPRER